MWEPLQSLLTSDTSTPPIKTQVLWVIGTALQNNPAAQEAVRLVFVHWSRKLICLHSTSI